MQDKTTPLTQNLGRVLIIAGSDPSGGAGIQADIKTVTALGGYAMTAITALTVQDTKGVYDVMPVPADFVRQQIKTCIFDIGIDAIKIGMIGDRETGLAILEGLSDAGWHHEGGSDEAKVPLILDPVLVATSGDRLSDNNVLDLIVEQFVPKAYLVTPNIPEAEFLCGQKIMTAAHQQQAGEILRGKGAKMALIKGGHSKGDLICDVLSMQSGVQVFENSKIQSTSTHGTGCTLASAIATRLALGSTINIAVESAIEYVRNAIATAPGFGKGPGPLNHGPLNHSPLTHGSLKQEHAVSNSKPGKKNDL